MKHPTYCQDTLKGCMEYFNVLVIQKAACHTFRPKWPRRIRVYLWRKVCGICWLATCSIDFPPAHAASAKVEHITVLTRDNALTNSAQAWGLQHVRSSTVIFPTSIKVKDYALHHLREKISVTYTTDWVPTVPMEEGRSSPAPVSIKKL